MICYKDMTFCCSPNCQSKCGRKFQPSDAADALRWWGNNNYPVSYAEFCDEKGELRK